MEAGTRQNLEATNIERNVKSFTHIVFKCLEELGLENPTKEELDLVDKWIRKIIYEQRDADTVNEPVALMLLHYGIHPYEVQKLLGDKQGRTMDALYDNFTINQYVRNKLREARENLDR